MISGQGLRRPFIEKERGAVRLLKDASQATPTVLANPLEDKSRIQCMS